MKRVRKSKTSLSLQGMVSFVPAFRWQKSKSVNHVPGPYHDAGTTLKLGKGLNVSMQQAFQSLIKEEVQGQGARVGKSDDKAGKPAAGLPDAPWAEVRPIGLCRLAGKGSQLQERLLRHGAEAGHQTAQLRGAAFIAAGADHLEDAGGTQARIRS